MRSVVALLMLALLAPLAAAQTPAFVHLGDDPTGDAQANGVPMLDTWVDINSLAVDTVDDALVFYLGLQGTTTEIGQYCWMAAWEFGGTEYVGLDCYEGVAYESDNTLSSVSAPDTSRGENVVGSVVFDDNGAVITVPLANFGAAIGDTIEDVYGLSYATRGLIVADTVPDAKRTAAADESLGSYRIGGPAPEVQAGPELNETVNETIEQVNQTFENAFDGNFTLAFSEPTNDTYVYSWQGEGTHDLNITWNGTGSFQFTLDGNGTAVNQTFDGHGAWTAPIILNNHTLRLEFNNFTGLVSVGASPVEAMDVPLIEDEESPAPVAFLALLGAALYARKRRT